MQTLLLVAELIIAIALIGFVLLQRSEGGGFGHGRRQQQHGGLFTARGAADTLTRTTSVLAFLFFLTCIVLNIMSLHGRDQTSILDSAPSTNIPAKPAAAAGGSLGTQTSVVSAFFADLLAAENIPFLRLSPPCLSTCWPPMARLIFITGGVVSSLGKGLASALSGVASSTRYKVRLRKLDPYLNVDRAP